MPPRECLLCAWPWTMRRQHKTSQPRLCPSATGKGPRKWLPGCTHSVEEIPKGFKISVFHWELDQQEREVFSGCQCFLKNTLNCPEGRAKTFESSQGLHLRVFLGSCLNSSSSMKCTFSVQAIKQASRLQTLSKASQNLDSEHRQSSLNKRRVPSFRVVSTASWVPRPSILGRLGPTPTAWDPVSERFYVGGMCMDVIWHRKAWEGRHETVRSSNQDRAVQSPSEEGFPVFSAYFCHLGILQVLSHALYL